MACRDIEMLFQEDKGPYKGLGCSEVGGGSVNAAGAEVGGVGAGGCKNRRQGRSFIGVVMSLTFILRKQV